MKLPTSVNYLELGVLLAVAYSSDGNVGAIGHLFQHAFSAKSTQALPELLSQLTKQELIAPYISDHYWLTSLGLAAVFDADENDRNRLLMSYEPRARNAGEAADILKYCLDIDMFMPPVFDDASAEVLQRFCASRYIWLVMGKLSPRAQKQIHFAAWFNTWSGAFKSDSFEHLIPVLESLPIKPLRRLQPDLALLGLQDMEDEARFLRPLSSDNQRELWPSSRVKRPALNTRTLIDIFSLSLYDIELARSIKETLCVVAKKANWTAPVPMRWLTLLHLIDKSGNELKKHVFADLSKWADSLDNGGKAPWGRVVIDLLLYCRVVTQDADAQSEFATQLGQHPVVERLLSQQVSSPIAHKAQAGLRQMLGLQDGAFWIRAEPWSQWLTTLSRLSSEAESEQAERLVWVLDETFTSLEAKIQSRGKRGWSKGRVIDVADIDYRYPGVLDEYDRVIVALASQRVHGGWGTHSTPITRSIARALMSCRNVFDEHGEPVSIYSIRPLVVLAEQDDRLLPQIYPQFRASVLTELDSGAVAYLDIPDTIKNLLSVLDKAPAGLPLTIMAELESQLRQCEHLRWHNELDQRGNIQLASWLQQPQLRLTWLASHLSLQVSIECQPELADYHYLSQPAGQGEPWIQTTGKPSLWFKRDLAQEKADSLALLKRLGLPTVKTRSWQLDLQDALSFMQALSEFPDVPVQWKTGAKVHVLDSKQLDIWVEQKQDWFAVDGSAQVDKALELELRTLLSHARGTFFHLDSGDVVLMTEQLKKQLQLLDSVLDDAQNVDQRMAYPLAQLFEGMSHRGDQAWDELIDTWRQKPVLNEWMLEPLRDYQRECVHWASHLTRHQFGACLADDMGLGKTLQALTVIRHIAQTGPSVVVAPKSVVHNWQTEAQRFAPELTVIDLEAVEDREATIETAAAGQLVVMSYGLMQRMEERLAAQDWQCAVLDEAQNIKNPMTKRAKAAFRLKAACRLALTGTPIENHLVELWSLFNFINPGLLGPRSAFLRTYGKAGESEQELARLRALVSPFILRRLKSQVLTELPAKTEIIHSVTLTKPERTAYEAVRKQTLVDMKKGKALIEVLSGMTRLRQVCCDPRLVFDSFSEPGSKLTDALELVQEALENGHRILVFSQFVKVLKAFAVLLDEARLAYSYLDGQSSSAKRKSAIQCFKQLETSIFLISLKAGGTGLNLTEADMVLHLDPWWNPAVEDQASDRAHRMGQTRPVTVYRLVAENSIEEKIVSLHAEKRELADKILLGQNDSQSFSPDLLLSLLSE